MVQHTMIVERRARREPKSASGQVTGYHASCLDCTVQTPSYLFPEEPAATAQLWHDRIAVAPADVQVIPFD